MATVLRSELSPKNKYYIDKHRYYELKHFCLQYKSWRKAYEDLNEETISISSIGYFPSSNAYSDKTAKYALLKNIYFNKIKAVEQAAIEADADLYSYIIMAVTEGISYTILKSKYDIPCSRDTYYDRYRRFFWLLDGIKD